MPSQLGHPDVEGLPPSHWHQVHLQCCHQVCLHHIIGRECQYFEAVHSESKLSKCIHNPVFCHQLLLLQDLKWICTYNMFNNMLWPSTVYVPLEYRRQVIFGISLKMMI